MAFNYDLSTVVGQIRLTIADTSSTAYIFEDAELQHFYDTAGSVNEAAIAALKVLLVDRARRVRRFSDQGLTLDDTAQVKALTEAIRLLGGEEPTASVVYPAKLPPDRGYLHPWQSS